MKKLSPRVQDAIERAIRTFVWAFTGAALVILGSGAGWDDIPAAASAGALAGLLSLLAALQSWSSPRKSKPSG